MEPMKPEWLVKPLRGGKCSGEVGRVLHRLKLHTVCQSAQCPNLGECFSHRTATFMIMGNICTRNCRFCAVEKGKPKPLEASEPERIAKAAKDLQMLHVVITSVTRDDLPDGGANHFAQTIAAIRQIAPNTSVEVLIPDFGGSRESVEVVVRAKPDVINHNVETVPRLYKEVRPKADYQRSLQVLKSVKEMNREIFTKSGLMIGLGETEEETLAVMKDLRQIDCDFLTLGQYLRPSEEQLPVARFIHPEEFQAMEAKGREMKFRGVAAGPFVRRSYKAGRLLEQGKEL
jgi:lipoic acid synthetase